MVPKVSMLATSKIAWQISIYPEHAMHEVVIGLDVQISISVCQDAQTSRVPWKLGEPPKQVKYEMLDST